MRIGVILDNEFDHDHRVQKEVRLLQKEGHQVFVLCFDFGKNYADYTKITVERIAISKKIKDAFVLLSTRFSFYERFWASYISSFINKHQIEAVHAHDLYMSRAAHLGIQQSDYHPSLTLDLHENYPAAINSYQWATQGWRQWVVNPKAWYKKEYPYLNYADKLVVLSHSFKETLLSKCNTLNPAHIFVHPNMPDLNSFESFSKSELKVDYQSDLPTLFYFGVVAKRRGIMDILDWINRLLEEGLLFNILIIGPADKADKFRFEKLLQLPLLKKHLTYLRWADVKYLPAYLKKIEIGLAPFEVNAQHDSGVANKLFQYMYGEIPILATACKAQKALIEQSTCGFIYTNFETFKEQLTHLVQSTELRQRLGANGKKKLFDLYAENADREFLRIYSER